MNLEEITKKVCSLTQQVGQFIKAERANFSSVDIETKSKNSLVSYVDKEAEKKLVEGLKSILPDAGFLTEEETVEQAQKDLKWIIDPLDGTTNFMHGIPVFAVSVALVNQSDLLVGVVHEINQNETFFAWQNGGAFLNEVKIEVTKTKTLENCLIATGFPYYDYQYLPKYLNTLSYLMNTTRGVRRLGSAAVDLAYVAVGRFDSFYEYSLHPWDVAAGALIVKEAGGLVNDFKGGDDFLFGKEIIASNSQIHDAMLSMIKEHFNS